MRTNHVGKSVLVGLLLAALLVGVFSSSAFAAASKVQATFANCNTLEITLHGQQAPTSSCLATTNTASPLTYARKCIGDGSDLILYWNGPFGSNAANSGPKLCIRGQGTYPLTGTQPDGRNWNDQASAWWAGCSDGEFWLNAGFNWPWQGSQFKGGNGANAPSGNFPYGNVGNDQLSQVELYTDC